ncbi:hypothetical protein LguiA_014465 [Lonicera macranthoides]
MNDQQRKIQKWSKCEVELDHFSREHPLELIDEVRRNKAGEEILCDDCRESVVLGSAAFGCSDKYILHKKCEKLPKEINHHLH